MPRPTVVLDEYQEVDKKLKALSNAIVQCEAFVKDPKNDEVSILQTCMLVEGTVTSLRETMMKIGQTLLAAASKPQVEKETVSEAPMTGRGW